MEFVHSLFSPGHCFVFLFLVKFCFFRVLFPSEKKENEKKRKGFVY